jgi:replication factor A1
MVVQLRVKSKDYGVFMITRRGEVVAQLRFDEEELERMRQLNDSALSSMAEAWKERGCKGAWKQGIYKSETLKIGDLKLDLIGVRLRAKVVEKSEPRIVDTRNGRLLFSLAVVSDGTGTIRMPLWGRRVSMVSVGDTVLVKGVRVKDYFGELQLRVGRGRGKLTVEVESLGEEAS